MHKWLKRIAFVLAALVTLLALIWAEENYRGKRAWEACQRELEAQGEKLEWATFAPPKVPDDQNFLKTPLLAAALAAPTNVLALGEEPTPNATQERLSQQWQWAAGLTPGDWRRGTVASLAQWQRELRSTNDSRFGASNAMQTRYGLSTNAPSTPAQPAINDPGWLALRARHPGTLLEDLQFLLQQHQADLDELRAAARRPYAVLAGERFDPAIALPNYALLKGLVAPFRASACVQLEAGKPDAALADIDTIFALADAAGSEPVLIGGLVQIAITDLSLQPVWFGLAKHLWQEPQLAQLEARLARINIVADIQRGLRGERAYSLAIMGGSKAATAAASGSPDLAMSKAMGALPAGFRYQSEVHIARAVQFLIDKFDPAGPSVKLSADMDLEVRSYFKRRTWYNTLAYMLLPALAKAPEKAASEQAGVTLARVACALERHRLATGAYPEQLTELTPRFLDRLPVDPVNGEPLKYRREAPDRFMLYSVGFNLKDDGGQPGLTSKGTFDARQGDWVWRSEPATN